MKMPLLMWYRRMFLRAFMSPKKKEQTHTFLYGLYTPRLVVETHWKKKNRYSYLSTGPNLFQTKQRKPYRLGRTGWNLPPVAGGQSIQQLPSGTKRSCGTEKSRHLACTKTTEGWRTATGAHSHSCRLGLIKRCGLSIKLHFYTTVHFLQAALYLLEPPVFPQNLIHGFFGRFQQRLHEMKSTVPSFLAASDQTGIFNAHSLSW